VNRKNLDQRHVSNAAIRARVAILAAERQLPKAETAWTGKLKHYDLMRFAQRHHVSLDWLIRDDLRGLLRQVRGQL
jgi:hypothetical protein